MSHWTEAQVIEAIRREFPDRPELSPRGIGDDCAVLCDGLTLLTTDASIEGVHFDLNWMSPAEAAWRCMASNVSDVGAMGAYAGPFSLALGLPASLSFEAIQSMIHAFRACIDAHGLGQCWLIGGDVVRSPVLMFSVTVLGAQPKWPVVMRSGARPGDFILVLGNPGYAAAGLDICMNGLRGKNPSDSALFEPFIQAFCTPIALTQLGPQLAQNGLVSAMMDTSDGIRTDLPRLLAQSGCGGVVDFDRFIPDDAMVRAAEILHKSPIDWMTSGGEDFGLLVTCRPDKSDSVIKLAEKSGIAARIIGSCTENAGVVWRENGCVSDRPDTSFVHF